MGSPAVEQIREALNASRRDSDRILAEAERRARALRERAEEQDRLLASAKIAEMSALGSEIGESSDRIQVGYVRMIEAMALASSRLVEAARAADFSSPPWPGGIERTVEVKLSETREVTFRFEPQSRLRTEGRPEPRMPRPEEEQT